jgi:hypothetical protein
MWVYNEINVEDERDRSDLFPFLHHGTISMSEPGIAFVFRLRVLIGTR